MSLNKCLFFWLCAATITGCSSVKNRLRSQNFLAYKSADCRLLSSFRVDLKKTTVVADDRVGIPDREVFDLKGLSEDEVEESYCSDYCESINRNAYRVGNRSNADEVFMTDYRSLSTIRLDFKAKTYERMERDFTGNLRIEKGSCEFEPLD